jgi:hypothetical protein
MSYRPKDDNIFKQGTLITAKENPALQLIIVNYYQRIYYCADAQHPDGRQRVYFERELNSPA